MIRRYTWEKTKAKLLHYRRRTPEASVLYQIVYHSRDDLQFQCKRRGVCPSCGAKRAVKFAEHIYSEVIEDIPHRHTVFTIPKRLRAFFKYDRKLNSTLFRAAWGALSQVLGVDDRELAAIFTVQTAGEALNHHPHLHGLLADGYWKDGVFSRFAEVDLQAIEQAFAERVLAQLHKLKFITDDDVAQILSQDHTGFGVPVLRSLGEGGWMGDPFHDKESEQFVARYILLRARLRSTRRIHPRRALNQRHYERSRHP